MKALKQRRIEMQVRLDWLADRMYPHRKCIFSFIISIGGVCLFFLIHDHYARQRIATDLHAEFDNIKKTLDIQSRFKDPTEKDEQSLTAFTEGLSSLFNDMPAVPVIIRSEKEFNFDGDSVLAVYCPAKSKANPIHEPVIIVRKEHFQYAAFTTIIETLKHEMIHAWLHWMLLATENAPYKGHSIAFIENAVALNLDMDNLGTGIPDVVLKAQISQIKEHGYTFLPRINDLATQWLRYLDLRELQDKGKLSKTSLKELDQVRTNLLTTIDKLNTEINSIK